MKNSITAWTANEDAVVDRIVSRWNEYVTDIEHLTIRFASFVNTVLSEYPEYTVKEIIRRVKNHPGMKRMVTLDKLSSGMTLVKSRPELVEYVLDYTPKQLKELPPDKRPVLKHDGTVDVEMYLELYKHNTLLDEPAKRVLEDSARQNNWTIKQLKTAIHELIDEETDKKNIVDNTHRKDMMKVLYTACQILDDAQLDSVIKYAETLIANPVKFQAVEPKDELAIDSLDELDDDALDEVNDHPDPAPEA